MKQTTIIPTITTTTTTITQAISQNYIYILNFSVNKQRREREIQWQLCSQREIRVFWAPYRARRHERIRESRKCVRSRGTNRRVAIYLGGEERFESPFLSWAGAEFCTFLFALWISPSTPLCICSAKNPKCQRLGFRVLLRKWNQKQKTNKHWYFSVHLGFSGEIDSAEFPFSEGFSDLEVLQGPLLLWWLGFGFHFFSFVWILRIQNSQFGLGEREREVNLNFLTVKTPSLKTQTELTKALFGLVWFFSLLKDKNTIYTS